MRRRAIPLGRLGWIVLGALMGALAGLLISHIPLWVVGLVIGAYIAVLVGPPRLGSQRRRDHPDDRWPSGPRDFSGRPVRPPQPLGGQQATAEAEVPRAEQVVEAAQALILKGKERGTLSPKEVLEAFPQIGNSKGDFARIATALTALGIDISEGQGRDAA